MSRVVVIGGGVVGLSCAYYARLAGFNVTVIEREPPSTEGCSFGNAGLIVPSHFVPLAAPGMIQMGLKMLPNRASPFGFSLRKPLELLRWTLLFARNCTPQHVQNSAEIIYRLNLKSLRLYRELSSSLGVGGEMHERGLLMICESEATLAHESVMAKKAAEMGIRAEIIETPRLQDCAGVAIHAKGGVVYHSDADIAPGRIMRALRESLNGCIRSGEEVVAFEKRDNKIAGAKLKSGEAIAGDEFILAAGSWSPNLIKGLPMLAGRGYSMTVPNPEIKPKIPLILLDGRVAITPFNDGLRFAGTMELGPPSDEKNIRRIEGIKQAVAAALPEYPPEIFRGIEPWVGQRPCSPDGLPYLGRSTMAPNLLLATGHAMMGMSLGPVTGWLISQLLRGEAPDLPIQQLDPNRYS